MTKRPTGLTRLLHKARAASRSTRIELRDQIAAYGPEGIAAVEPWISDADFGAFAVRVIQSAASEHRDAAIAALRDARTDAATETIRMDIDDALEELDPAGPRKPVPPDVTMLGKKIPPDAGASWLGFQDHEFGQIAGTTWRSRGGRTSLAPLITIPLRYRDPRFESYAITRSPEIHFALRPRYEQGGEHEQGWRAAKLVVNAHGPTNETPDRPRVVTAGLYVEKGDGSAQFGPLDDRWDWNFLLRALREEHVRRDELGRLMRKYDLSVGDYVGGSSAVGWVGRIEGEDLVLRNEGAVVGRGYDDLVDLLAALPEDRWVELHLWHSWPAEEAIAGGRAFGVRTVADLLTDLSGLYLDIVNPVLPRITG